MISSGREVILRGIAKHDRPRQCTFSVTLGGEGTVCSRRCARLMVFSARLLDRGRQKGNKPELEQLS